MFQSLSRSRSARNGLLVLGLAALAHGVVSADDALRAYYANDPVGRNVVAIHSEAPLETILTRTSDVTAQIKINPANILDHPSAKFVINMDSLDTGIALRNEHMKSPMWMDTTKFPTATFTLTKVLAPNNAAPMPLAPGLKGSMPVEGELDLHGVKKTVRAQVEAETIPASAATEHRLKGDLAHIKASFPLTLSDFNIQVPPMAKLEVAPTMQVSVDTFVSTGSDAPAWSGQ